VLGVRESVLADSGWSGGCNGGCNNTSLSVTPKRVTGSRGKGVCPGTPCLALQGVYDSRPRDYGAFWRAGGGVGVKEGVMDSAYGWRDGLACEGCLGLNAGGRPGLPFGCRRFGLDGRAVEASGLPKASGTRPPSNFSIARNPP
jgi:hypothetical protein